MFALVKSQVDGTLAVTPTEEILVLNVRSRTFCPFKPESEVDFSKREYGIKKGDQMVRHLIIQMSTDSEKLCGLMTDPKRKVRSLKSNYPAQEAYDTWGSNNKKEKKEKERTAKSKLGIEIENELQEKKKRKVELSEKPADLNESPPSSTTTVAQIHTAPSQAPSENDGDDSNVADRCLLSSNDAPSSPVATVVEIHHTAVSPNGMTFPIPDGDDCNDHNDDCNDRSLLSSNALSSPTTVIQIQAVSPNGMTFPIPNVADKSLHSLNDATSSPSSTNIHAKPGPCGISQAGSSKTQRDGSDTNLIRSYSFDSNDSAPELKSTATQTNTEEEQAKCYLDEKFSAITNRLERIEEMISNIRSVNPENPSSNLRDIIIQESADGEGAGAPENHVSFGMGIYLPIDVVKSITEKGDKITYFQGKVNDLSYACFGPKLANLCLAKIRGNKSKDLFPEKVIRRIRDAINVGNVQYNFNKIIRKQNLSKLSPEEFKATTEDVMERARIATSYVTLAEVREKLSKTLFNFNPEKDQQQND